MSSDYKEASFRLKSYLIFHDPYACFVFVSLFIYLFVCLCVYLFMCVCLCVVCVRCVRDARSQAHSKPAID